MSTGKGMPRSQHILLAGLLNEADTRLNDVLDAAEKGYGYTLIAQSVQRAMFHLNVARSFLSESATDEYPGDEDIQAAYRRQITTPLEDERS